MILYLNIFKMTNDALATIIHLFLIEKKILEIVIRFLHLDFFNQFF